MGMSLVWFDLKWPGIIIKMKGLCIQSMDFL